MYHEVRIPYLGFSKMMFKSLSSSPSQLLHIVFGKLLITILSLISPRVLPNSSPPCAACCNQLQGRGSLEGGAGGNFVRVLPVSVRGSRKIIKALRVPVHRFDIFFKGSFQYGEESFASQKGDLACWTAPS